MAAKPPKAAGMNGKVQNGGTSPASQPASGGRHPGGMGGPGETEGVSPGAISKREMAPEKSGAGVAWSLGGFLLARLFLR